jgi:hypothetical protein
VSIHNCNHVEASNFYTLKENKFSEAHAIQITGEVTEMISSCCVGKHILVTEELLEDKHVIKVHLMAGHAV